MFPFTKMNIIPMTLALIYEACKPAVVLGFASFLIWGQAVALQVFLWVFGLYLGVAALLVLAGLSFSAYLHYNRKKSS